MAHSTGTEKIIAKGNDILSFEEQVNTILKIVDVCGVSYPEAGEFHITLKKTDRGRIKEALTATGFLVSSDSVRPRIS